MLNTNPYNVNYPFQINNYKDLKEEDRKYMLEVYSDSDSTNMNRFYSLTRPYIGFFCKKCYHPIILRANISIELEYLYDVMSEETSEDTSIWCNPEFSIRCPECGEFSTWHEYLDPAITPALAELNKKGYETLFSCQGHTHVRDYCRIFPEAGDDFKPAFCNMMYSSDAYIAFAKSISKDVVEKYPLIDPWHLCKHKIYNEDISFTIRTDDEEDSDLVKRMVSLYKWVESLPSVR